MSALKIITTRDGSHSLLHEQLNETYHSVHGAVQESKHVFIENGLNVLSQKDVQLLEIGFGTGLNAWLTLQQADLKKLSIHYTTLESFPVEKNIWSVLNYTTSDTERDWFEKLHE